MTVTYSLEVSKVRLLGFLRLLMRWKGSIYRLMYREMIIFALLYYVVAFIYRYLLPPYYQRSFERIALYCRDFTELIPITFVLGFYVSLVVSRWWKQYMSIPWPDRAALNVATYVQGNDDKGRMIRRAMVRYLNLMNVITLQATSTVIKKRFPTLAHMEEAGLMTVDERIALEETPAPHGNYFIPASWFCHLAWEARKEGRIHDDYHLKTLINEAMDFRGLCGAVWSYDWISVPLVYTQVVALAVYCFFASCLVGRQYLYQEANADGKEDRSNAVDFYVPIFTLFQFFLYMGWLKVAEEMICPFGEDDDDFEMNWIVDRNLQVGYSMVDDLYRKHPKLTKDIYWGETEPQVPYTTAAAEHRTEPYLGSTVQMNIDTKGMEWVPEPEPIAEEECGGDEFVETGDRHPSLYSNESEAVPVQPKMLQRLLSGVSRRSSGGTSFRSRDSSMSTSKGQLNSIHAFMSHKRSLFKKQPSVKQSHYNTNRKSSQMRQNSAVDSTVTVPELLDFMQFDLQIDPSLDSKTASRLDAQQTPTPPSKPDPQGFFSNANGIAIDKKSPSLDMRMQFDKKMANLENSKEDPPEESNPTCGSWLEQAHIPATVPEVDGDGSEEAGDSTAEFEYNLKTESTSKTNTNTELLEEDLEAKRGEHSPLLS